MKSKVDADTGWSRLGRQWPRLALLGAAFAVAGCLIVPPKADAGTADHGRADTFNEHGAKFPESARVWLVATGSPLGTGGALAAPSERRLADVAPTVREIAGLPSDLEATAGTPLDELLRRD